LWAKTLPLLYEMKFIDTDDGNALAKGRVLQDFGVE
jgi:hypothetical protein